MSQIDPSLLPNLFVPGAQKSGTSTLHEYLARHPDICMSSPKEPHYFMRPDKGLDYYSTMFSTAGEARYRGESSVGYMTSPTARRAIAESVADPRFIFLLRNPVDRAWSHYWWASGRYGPQPKAFRDAFRDDSVQSPKDPMWPLNLTYYHTGLYDKWLAPYIKTFGAERIFIGLFEDFISSPPDTLDRICCFLDIDPFPEIGSIRINKTTFYRFPKLLKTYGDVGRIGGKIAHNVLPNWAQLTLANRYHSVHRELGRRLASGSAPELDGDTRRWLVDFYRESVLSLRSITDLSLAPWEADFPMK